MRQPYPTDYYTSDIAMLLLQEEDEAPDDESLNQMIARNEDEFELFQVWTMNYIR